MRIYRSPKDGVVEIDVQSFGLKGLFAIVTLVACVIGFIVLRQRVPLREATIVHAVCFRSDWNSPTESIPQSQQGDYIAYNFDLDEPGKLFEKLSTKPVLWAKTKVAELIRIEDERTWAGRIRHRPADRPVDGLTDKSFEPNTVTDRIMLGGSFERATHSRRYYLDFTVELLTQTPSGRQVLSHSSHRLKYRGSVNGELIVFAIPIEGELLHLVIVDLDERAAAPSLANP